MLARHAWPFVIVGWGLCLGVAGSAAPVWAGDTAEISYHVLRGAADKIAAARASSKAKTDKILMTMVVTRKTPSDDPIALWIDRPTGRQDIPVSPDGTITLPSTPELVAEDPLVHANALKGTLDFGLSLNIVLPAPPFDYADVIEATGQLDAFIKEQSPVSFFAPKTKALQLFMDPAAGNCVVGLAVAGANVETLKPDSNGIVTIELSDALAAENPKIVPSCPLLKHDIDVE